MTRLRRLRKRAAVFVHLLEVGVFGVLDQLQENSLGGGEVRSALLQPGQSKQTVRLAVEGDAKVATCMRLPFSTNGNK